MIIPCWWSISGTRKQRHDWLINSMEDYLSIRYYLNGDIGYTAKSYKLRVSLISNLCAKMISFNNYLNSKIANDRNKEGSKSGWFAHLLISCIQTIALIINIVDFIFMDRYNSNSVVLTISIKIKFVATFEYYSILVCNNFAPLKFHLWHEKLVVDSLIVC